jgi:5-methylthioadenosine/S-adenosylhomocysteine deaminase
MRAAVFQQRARTQRLESLDAHAAFRMATIGGAECLGLGARLGSLDLGKRADFVVVDLNDPAVQPVHDPVEAMVYSASRQNVRATFIGGREVQTDPSALLKEIPRIVERLRG